MNEEEANLWFETKSKVLFDSDEPIGAIFSTRDITNKKKTHERMVNSEKMAALGGLVAGIAHESNTPIGVSVTAASYLDQKTKNLIKAEELNRVGKNGILINLSRGQVINEKDLFNALKEKLIHSTAIDVWYDYDPVPDEDDRKYPFHYPFHELDNIILSPHRAASPFDDLKRWDEVIENISRYAEGETKFINVVDLDKEY